MAAARARSSSRRRSCSSTSPTASRSAPCATTRRWASPRRSWASRSSRALAVLFRRVPTAFAIAAVATIPFRIPISVAGSTSNLLLPLYLVVAAGALSWAWPRLRGEIDQVSSADLSRQGAVPIGWVERLLAITLVLYAAQSAYAEDGERALENVVFFYVPFAILYVLIARLAWTRRLAGIALGRADGARRRARVDRLRGVRDPPPAAQPEGHRLQPARGLLPRQLAVLRPEHLRPLPRRRARPARRVDAVALAHAGRRARGRWWSRSCSAGLRADAVAVELRGAARRARGPRRAALERALGADRRGAPLPWRSSSRSRSGTTALRRRRQLEQGDERPLGPRRRAACALFAERPAQGWGRARSRASTAGRRTSRPSGRRRPPTRSR